MKKEDGISKYKLNKIATESLRNTIRLHFDSVLLYENGSYPSALQLSVLALEEFSKANWVDHYIWTSETNEGYLDAESEQEWLKLRKRPAITGMCSNLSVHLIFSGHLLS